MAEHTIDVRVRPRLDAVTVRPGDKLVVRVPVGMSLAGIDEWRARFADLLPGVEVVFVAAEQLLVYRPDGDDEIESHGRPLPNKADAAWEELNRLRSRAAELGIDVDDAWPIARLRDEITIASAGERRA